MSVDETTVRHKICYAILEIIDRNKSINNYSSGFFIGRVQAKQRFKSLQLIHLSSDTTSLINY